MLATKAAKSAEYLSRDCARLARRVDLSLYTNEMSFNVAGRAALITGCASGIGHAAATQLLRKGLRELVAVDMNPKLPSIMESLQESFPSAKIHHVIADVTDESALAAAFETKLEEPLTIVANNVSGSSNVTRAAERLRLSPTTP